jgi:hypothetical protein
MDQATAIQKYEDALTSLLVHARTGRQFDFDLQTQFHKVSVDAEPYRNTPEYRDAVFRADSRAWDLARPANRSQS